MAPNQKYANKFAADSIADSSYDRVSKLPDVPEICESINGARGNHVGLCRRPVQVTEKCMQTNITSTCGLNVLELD